MKTALTCFQVFKGMVSAVLAKRASLPLFPWLMLICILPPVLGIKAKNWFCFSNPLEKSNTRIHVLICSTRTQVSTVKDWL
ncbi:hypothetical protein D3C76_1251410 [compost metagenome]